MKEHILIADDEKEILSLLRLYLENSGYRVSEASDGETACSLIRNGGIDLAILDIMMPKMDGYAVIRRIREQDDLPIIVLSAKSETTDKIMGLGLGADDYIAKPFDGLEVVARVEACLRRLSRTKSESAPSEASLTVRDLTLDTEKRTAYKRGERVDLTAREFDLAELFLRSPGRVFSRDSLLDLVWGYDYQGDARTVDVHIRRLREKLEDDPASPSLIITKWGVGYYLAE